MEERKPVTARRSAGEWRRLVRAWDRSGQTAKDFATARGLSSRTLSWWKWRLSREPPAGAPDEPRLLPVKIEPDDSSVPEPCRWDIVFAGGQVLQVYVPLETDELQSILRTLRSAAE